MFSVPSVIEDKDSTRNNGFLENNNTNILTLHKNSKILYHFRQKIVYVHCFGNETLPQLTMIALDNGVLLSISSKFSMAYIFHI